ncbi:MAG TPA: thioredoxin domain-containing protein [Patescibacteria group bacterium]|nr:thioredoxin domain-containing protein [Patescibacteria group bacterium]
MLEILDFYADWCGPCRMMEPIFEELKKEYQGRVKFTVINADENPEKSAEHHVLGIPTYIFLREGREVDRIVGFTPKPAFAARLDHHLEEHS